MNWQEKEAQLNDLFKRWQSAQIEDNEYESYRNKDYCIEIHSFAKDGFIAPEAYWSAPERVLFIGKEAHITYKKEQGERIAADDVFFLKKQIESNILMGKPMAKSQKSIDGGLALLYNAYRSCDFENLNLDTMPLRSVGFMNLNKRGGTQKCRMDALGVYIRIFRDYLVAQIEIMEPDIIICCGCHDTVKKQLIPFLKRGDCIPILDTYHFSTPKSPVKKLQKLRESMVINGLI